MKRLRLSEYELRQIKRLSLVFATGYYGVTFNYLESHQQLGFLQIVQSCLVEVGYKQDHAWITGLIEQLTSTENN